jgi:predicted nucleic acid-binding protein
MRTAPDAQVVAWLDRQPAESVWIASITMFEARLGLVLLVQGPRRRALEAALLDCWRTTWKTACWISTRLRQPRPHPSLPTDKRSGGLQICARREDW